MSQLKDKVILEILKNISKKEKIEIVHISVRAGKRFEFVNQGWIKECHGNKRLEKKKILSNKVLLRVAENYFVWIAFDKIKKISILSSQDVLYSDTKI